MGALGGYLKRGVEKWEGFSCSLPLIRIAGSFRIELSPLYVRNPLLTGVAPSPPLDREQDTAMKKLRIVR